MKEADKNRCPYCKATFLPKGNQDRHVMNVHQEDDQVYVGNDAKVM